MDVGAPVRYHPYQWRGLTTIGVGLFVMILIPTLILRGELWQRLLFILFGLAVSGPLVVASLLHRGDGVGVFANALVIRLRGQVRTVRWSDIVRLETELIPLRESALYRPPPSMVGRLHLRSGEVIQLRGGAAALKDIDFLLREIERRVSAAA